MEGGRPEVVGALEVVMADKEEQSFEGVEVALPRAVWHLGGGGEGVVDTEVEVVASGNGLLQFAAGREVAEGQQGIHFFLRGF